MVPRSKYDLINFKHLKIPNTIAKWFLAEHGEEAQEKMRDILQAHIDSKKGKVQ